ncbi:unnamed protein product [Orchesella dallaii]|uniref:Lipase n=1 Tax=Orchesella dallaii TaxID=48710 RepID=A0ABP1QJZ9_9HEXA
MQQRLATLLLGLLGLVALASSKALSNPLADNEDAKLTVPELIVKYGYPVEIHTVTTSDGYIKEVHRIPYGKRCGPAEGKRVIWLQHGLLGDSSNWIVAGPEKGLAYNLADECYDVWMGNYRGNTYSKRHVSLDPVADKEQFWSFSWNEMGLFDLPADFDYVLNATGTDGLYYVGHSMGTTGFWVCMSEHPEYNAKIKLMNAYAPVSYTQHMISPIALIAPFSGQVEWLLGMFGLYEFLPSNAFMDFIGQTVCHQNSLIKDICSNVLFLVAGFDSDQMDSDLMPTIMGHVPAGASVRSLVHYAQGVMSGVFRKYDFGRATNLEVYGQVNPPEYDISKITAPVALYWGENDWLGVKSDVYRLAEQLPNIQRKYRINHDKYNHLDFLWAKDNVELINQQTIEFMKHF